MIRRRILVAAAAATALATLALLAPDEEMRLRVVTERAERLCGRGKLPHRRRPEIVRNRALAAVLSARGPALVSHLGAAYLHGFEKINVPGFVDITVPRHRRPRRRPGVTVHESKAFDLAGAVVRNRIPVPGVARTILDCSSVVDEPIRLLDDALRRRIVTWGELWSCHLSHNVTGRHGIAVYRRILLERDGNTPPGGNFARLMAAGLPAPVFEHPVSVAGPRLLPGPRLAGASSGGGVQ